jgi:hypothetical protein
VEDKASSFGRCFVDADPNEDNARRFHSYRLDHTTERRSAADGGGEVGTGILRLALVFLEYLVFSCGYTQADVDDYFRKQNFEDVIFLDYENLRRITTCTDIESDLTLHEFKAEVHETDYAIRFWIKLDSKTRVLDMMLVFPRGLEMELDKYTKESFPELSSCQM